MIELIIFILFYYIGNIFTSIFLIAIIVPFTIMSIISVTVVINIMIIIIIFIINSVIFVCYIVLEESEVSHTIRRFAIVRLITFFFWQLSWFWTIFFCNFDSNIIIWYSVLCFCHFFLLFLGTSRSSRSYGRNTMFIRWNWSWIYIVVGLRE